MPKGTDMAGCSTADASLIEMLLNERPRKCLACLSPGQSVLKASLHLKWQSAPLEISPPALSNHWKIFVWCTRFSVS
jgi:hypothetical protein